ncbi:MAG: galactitol-1-phosphate 5-dehydrogenase [Planctomycetia bacterium]|nr:galactitol-1-phosphate 5-dehydrogenase [Planctomycetia bacterium]
MKALVLTQYNHFEMQDVPVPALGPEDVLVEVRACGICGSDVHGMDGGTGRRVPPVIMGHEAAGVVARLGTDVGDWAEGDRVTFDSTIYCGRCFFCRQGRINLCDHRRVLGVSCDEYRQDGAMAEYVAVPRHILYRLPEGLDFRRAALVEPLSVAVHAVGRMTLAPDDTVAVIGAGMIGLLVIQALRAAGCRRIIAVDLDDHRLALAGRFGAAWQWRADAVDVPAAVADLTEGRGADAALEVVGIGSTLATAVACLRKGGELVLVGNVSPRVELPLQAVVTRELSLRGSCASQGEYPECLDMIARGAVDVDPLTSAVVALAEGPRWFDRLHSGESGLLKVVLDPSI